MKDIIEIGKKYGVNLKIDKSLDKYSKVTPPKLEAIKNIDIIVK